MERVIFVLVHHAVAGKQNETHQRSANVLGLDVQVPIVPAYGERSAHLNDGGGASPTAFVLGGRLAPEVHQVAGLEIQLLYRKAGFGVQSAPSATLGSLLDKMFDCDLTDTQVVS